jgi:peroxiredoxin
MRAQSPEPGAPAPEFVLKTPGGIEVPLASCLLEGPVLIDFIRGTWDPDARRRLDALTAALERFRKFRARVLVIACERAVTVARYLEQKPSPLTVLVDEDRSVARRYGVLRRFSLPVWNVARPSSFLVDRCGFVRYAYLAPLQIHSASIDQIVQVLERI